MASDTLVYVGTFTGPKSKGIYCYRLQTENLEVSQNITLAPLGLAAETPNPAFLELDLKRRLLFAVNENDSGATVSAFRIEAAGKLTPINQQPAKGDRPCHLALDKSGKTLIVANYATGNVAVFPVAADGRLGEASQVIQHAGKSAHPERQAGPHAHGVTFDPANRFVFVCDLGIDKVMAYRFDAAGGKLATADPAFTAMKAGAGPRHMVFRPDGKFAYVVNELDSTIATLAYDTSSGALRPVDTQSTLPPYFDGKNAAAEIGMHPSGKWVYVSNRGNETVVLFEIDRDTGKPTYVEEQGTGGKTPRHFGIQPNAKHLVICNQDTNQVLACRIDSGNGRLKPSGVFAEAPSPVCAVFLPPASEVTG